MPMQNIIPITVDIKLSNYILEKKVTNNDKITFVIDITDNGQPFELTNVNTVTLANKRLDGRTVITPGSKSGTNQVIFNLGRSETSVNGRVDATVQLYDADGRVSTITFRYDVIKDPTGSTYLALEGEQTLIEMVLGDGPLRIQEAIEATNEANLAVVEINNKKTEVSDFLANSEINYQTFESEKETEFQAFKVAKNNEVQAVIVEADTKIAEVEQVAADNVNIPVDPVDTIALRNSTYPNPQHGTVVNVLQGASGMAETYRFKTGTGWGLIDKQNATTISNITTQLAEKATQVSLNTTNANVALKADKTYVDSNYSTLDAKINSQASGSPQGTYTTLAALQSAFPTGNTNIYIVTADGGWYYWNGTAWTFGGVYQATDWLDALTVQNQAWGVV